MTPQKPAAALKQEQQEQLDRALEEIAASVRARALQAMRNTVGSLGECPGCREACPGLCSTHEAILLGILRKEERS